MLRRNRVDQNKFLLIGEETLVTMMVSSIHVYNEKQNGPRLYRRQVSYAFSVVLQSAAERLNDGLAALIETLPNVIFIDDTGATGGVKLNHSSNQCFNAIPFI